MSYKLNDKELLEHWEDQLTFIQSSIVNFDNGNENEARRIATSLRIMFHQTRLSKSLFHQLKLNHKLFLWSSGGLYTPSNLLSSWTLLKLKQDINGLSYEPLGLDNERTFYLCFDDWWNEIIFDDKKNVFTRKDVITFVANQDGGAHVDDSLGQKYAELVKHNSLGWSDGWGNAVSNNPVYNAIRQIAQEVILSYDKFKIGFMSRYKQKDKNFEMRFFDETRRYKWSSTEINYSEETLQIVNQFTKEFRTLYIQETKDGARFELILR
ncbi:hypothetical protein [Macrococcoides caseolyticum]|uniref:hypothetical protein n=1 Tax=Macrococcoides caseolyticum TaxID=69966 RepID=UPI000C15B211|nr:hypothetical protein [Macrococcus caseolyticus]PKE63134.1 hypothetical protein CW683_06350 [Macrococcus caseolyticus]RAI80154.1 hypothetical protein BFS34_007180 [Macrococcus caseolyticus subsp. hominis]